MLVSVLAALTLAAPASTAVPPKPPPRPPAFVVVVDPGHGGDQDGALSPSGVKEKDVVLQIARRLRPKLEQLGAKVVLTRTGDIGVPLTTRAAVANGLKADLFVSIHLNSMATAEGRRVSSGVETYFLSADASDANAAAAAARENADRMAGEPLPDPGDPVAGILQDLEESASLAGSSRLAYALHDRLVAGLGSEDRGVKQAPFYVLAGARMPAVLLEVGFISNGTESQRLTSAAHQEKIAGAIAAGVGAWREAERRR
jgi:N-acetylmuramoyl-L-alanine amidase